MRSVSPESPSYSMHYYGLSLPWDGPADERVLHVGNRPQIYIAAGSHATYPASRLWDTPDVWDIDTWRSFFNVKDWYPRMYGAAENDYDDAVCPSQVDCSLVPLEKYAIWRGHWGQVGAGEPFWADLTDKDDGPPSPAYRPGAGVHLYVDPVGFPNNVLSDGWRAVPTK